MANYQNLKAAISAAIRTNGNQEITGQVLQDVLNSIVSVIGANYTFAGVATPATNPGTPDQNVMYLAMDGGTYTNFNGTVLPAGISLLMWNGTWTSETVMYGDGGVFDISVYKSSGGTLATFADLAAALNGGNNIPVGARKGGMSVKFVQSSDNNYVQFRCIADEFTTDVTKWKGEYSVLKGSEVKDYIFKGNIGADNKWKNLAEDSTRFYGLLIPIIGGHSYSLILTDELKRYAFLTDNTLEEEATPAYAGEASSYSTFSGNQLVVITAPSDATYLYVSATDSNGKYVEPVFIGDNYRNSYITDYNIMLVCDTLPTLSNNTLTFGSQTRIRVLTPKYRIMIAEKILSANTTFTINSGVGLYLDMSSLNLVTFNYGDYDASKGQMVFILGNFRGTLFHSLSELFSKELVESEKITKSHNYTEAEKKIARINIGIPPIVKGTELKDYIFDGNIAVDNKWKNINSGDWYGLVIPVTPNQSYALLMTDNLKRYAFLQNNTITNETTPSYAGGASAYSAFSGNLLTQITAPADAYYLYLSASDTNGNYVEPILIGGLYRSELLQNCYSSFLTNDIPSLINNTLYFNNSSSFKIRVFCPYYRDEVAEVDVPANHSVALASGKGLYIDFASLALTVKDFSDPHTNDGQMLFIFGNFRGVLFKDMMDRIISKRVECLNRGKKIAVFGGSFSIIEESLKAKELWESILGCKVDSWGIEGSGFGKNTHHATEEQIAYSEALSHTRWTWVDDDGVTHEGEVSIQGQVEQACADAIEAYDIYILWASTNDFNTYPCPIGTRDSYTSADSFDENARLTQCGGINYCIKKILEKNPNAQILFFGSMRFYSAEWGYNIYSDHTNIYDKTFKDYIDGQIACCEKFCIPYLDQWNMMDINEYNYSSFYKSDHTHMKNEGYVRAGYKQAAFISNGVDND